MVRIALPNKGRLATEARELFELAGLAFEFAGERALRASLGGEFLALFVRAQDVPAFVADGAADLGVTGHDLIVESGRDVREVLDLGFGACRVVVAARDDSSIQGIRDVPAGSRVATVFPSLAKACFEARDCDVTIVPVSGAAEIAPHLGVADIIVDITSTGSTLEMNGLREVETILESSARLIAGPTLLESPNGERAARELAAALESVLRAQGKRYLMANVPRARLEQVKRIIPGLNGPTIIDILNGGDHVAAHAVVDATDVYRIIAELKQVGAEGILVTRIERLMP